MKRIDKLNMIHSEVKKDYKPKMVKGRTGWVVKGFVFATLLGAGSLATVSTDDVQAAEWRANTAEMIRAKIKEGDTSYTFAEGDTFYEIGQAINVKYTVLMELNGFKEGSQYTVPVGTTITFDGRKVTLTDKEGNVVKEQILSDKDKVDTSKTFMNQKSDDVKSTNTSNTTNGGSTNGVNGNGGTKPNPVNPVNPVEPTNPVTPVDPTDPTDPIKPIDPTDPELSELEKLKAYLTELEAQLVVAKQELATAEQNLSNAQNGANVDYDIQIAALEALIADKLAQQAIIGDEIIALEGQQIALQGELVTAQNELANAYASRNEAQQTVNAAQAALEAIQSTEDAEQIANAEAALASAQTVLNEANQQVSNAESVVNEKENALTSVDSSIATKQEQLASLDTLEDTAKLAELKAQKEQQENNQQSIAELEQIVAEKQKVVSDLEAKIEETKQKIAAIELKVERANAINTINGLEYLSNSSKNTYANQVNSALNTETINAIVQAAINENNMLKDEHEAAEAFKKAKADAIKTVSSLEYLDADGKADYIAIIESAENIETINAAVSNAQAEDAKIKAEFEANKELAQAKENAKAEINQLTFLSADSKASYKTQISDAKTIAEIAPIVETAKAENAKIEEEHNAAEALQKAKDAAIAEINSLEYIMSEAKADYIKDVQSAENVEQINLIVNTAKAEDAKLGEENEAAKKLAAAKAEAINGLEELNLTDAQKADFTAQINAATAVEAITPIVEAAKVQSNKNDEAASAKELQEAKDVAKAEIAKMNLTADEKAKFSKDVDNAKTISEVKSATAKAQEQAAKNTEAEEAAKKLAEAKAKAKTDVAKMNLTADEKSAFEKQIDNASTIAEVNFAVEAAKVQSDKNTAAEEDAKKLAEAKANAKTEIAKMNLTDAQRNEFNGKVDNASTIAGVNSVVAEAQAQSDKNSQTEEDAKKLAEAKKDALGKIDKMNLKADEKAKFTKQINEATTIEQVNQTVAEAQKVSDYNDANPVKKTTVTFEVRDKYGNVIDTIVMDAEGDTYSFTKEELGLGDYEIIQGENLLSGKTHSQEGGNKKIRLVVKGPSIFDSEVERENFDNTFNQNINDLRKEQGLNEVEQSEILNEAANIRAKELAELFEHDRPDGTDGSSVLSEVEGGYIFNGTTENIATSGGHDMSGEHAAQDVFNRWLNSEGHRAGMLSEDATHYGIGYYYDEADGKTYICLLLSSERNYPIN